MGEVFSITSILKLSGEADETPEGYGEVTAALSMASTLVEGGDYEL